MYGVDTFIDALPGGDDSPCARITYELGGTISFNTKYRDMERSWYDALNAMVRADAHLNLDEVLLSGGYGQERLRSTFSTTDLAWVEMHADPDAAASREANRVDRIEEMARHQALSVYAGGAYDIEADTTHLTINECARDLANQLSLKAPSV